MTDQANNNRPAAALPLRTRKHTMPETPTVNKVYDDQDSRRTEAAGAAERASPLSGRAKGKRAGRGAERSVRSKSAGFAQKPPGIDPMSPGRSLPERRRAQIVEAAVRLFSERGYFQSTIDDIADEIKLSKGLIYRYFKDKNDLLFYSLRHVHEKYRPEVIPELIAEVGPLAALIQLMSLHCRLAKDHTLEVALAYRSTRDLLPEQRREMKILESKTARMIRQCLEACFHGGLMTSMNTEVMAYQYVMFGHTWALKNWAFRDRLSADEYMAEGENILVSPFLTPAGKKELERIKGDKGDEKSSEQA